MDIIFDIETAPVIYGDYTTTDDEGNQKDIGALSPITGRIIAIGLRQNGQSKLFIDTDEKKVIQSFWDAIVTLAKPQKGYFQLVGFNVKQFDVHFLLVRSLHHNITVPKFARKYVIDLRERLTFFHTYMKKGTLNDYAQLIGIEGKTHDNAQIPELWKAGKISELKEYLEQDLFITEKLYEKCKTLGILEIY